MVIETCRPIFRVDRPCRELRRLIGSSWRLCPALPPSMRRRWPSQLQLHCSSSLLVTFAEIKAVVAMATAAGRVATAAAVEPSLRPLPSTAGAAHAARLRSAVHMRCRCAARRGRADAGGFGNESAVAPDGTRARQSERRPTERPWAGRACAPVHHSSSRMKANVYGQSQLYIAPVSPTTQRACRGALIMSSRFRIRSAPPASQVAGSSPSRRGHLHTDHDRTCTPPPDLS